MSRPLPRIIPRFTFYRGWWLVGAALLAQFVATGIQVYSPAFMLRPMSDELGWTRAEFTSAQTMGQFAMAGIGFVIGAKIDRYGPRPLMLIGATIMVAATFLTSQITELWQWFALRGLVFTVGAALIGNLVVNVTLSQWFVERRGRAIGVAAMGLTMGGVVLPLTLTPIIDAYGWRFAWQMLAVVAAVLVYPSALVMRRRPEEVGLYPDGKTEEEVKRGEAERARVDYAHSFTRAEAVRTPQFYLVVFGFAVGGAVFITVLSQGIAFMTDAGFSRTTAAAMITIYAIPSMLSKPFWGSLADRVHPRYIASVTFGVTFLSVISIVASANAGSTVLLALSFVLFGLGIGGSMPLQETIWASYFGRRYLGQVRGAALPFSISIGAGAPILTALYFDMVGTYDAAFLTFATLSLAGSVLVLLAKPPALPERMREEGTPAAAAGPGASEVPSIVQK